MKSQLKYFLSNILTEWTDATNLNLNDNTHIEKKICIVKKNNFLWRNILI